MAQWVKDPTAAAGVAAEAQVGSIPGPAQRVTDPALPQLWHGSQLQLRYYPWPRAFPHAVGAAKKKIFNLKINRS